MGIRSSGSEEKCTRPANDGRLGSTPEGINYGQVRFQPMSGRSHAVEVRFSTGDCCI